MEESIFEKKFLLCAARHSHPEIDGMETIFGNEIDPIDFHSMLHTVKDLFVEKFRDRPEDDIHIILYVTGLTAAAMAVVESCILFNFHLTLMHYDRTNDRYVPQKIHTYHPSDY